ncbi:MAG TPA: NlpC/P60 family protein [Paraburkholderia sp.]
MAALLAACSSAPQKTVRSPSGTSAAASGAFRTPPPGFPHFVDHSVGREEISIQAMSLVGVPYRWGGNTPESGFDCSGLVRYVVLRSASVNLPRTTADMSSRGDSIEPDEIAAGDLIFFNTTGRPHSHVGIYVGKLRFVNAPSTGGTVRLDYLTNPYWAKRFDGIRRVAAPTSAPKPTPFDAPSYDASVSPPADRQTPLVPPVAVDNAPAQPSAVAQGNTRIAAARGAPVTASAGSGANGGAAAPSSEWSNAANAQSADPFEPPPGIGAAQAQARAAGAVSPSAAAPMERSAPNDAAALAATPSTATQTRGASSATEQQAPPASDSIDAAADAYEPPPPAAIAARQAEQAQESQRPAGDTGGVQIMRASTASRGIPAPTQTNDDPIAGFANSRY